MYSDRAYLSPARRSSPFGDTSSRKLYNTSSSDARLSSTLNRGKDGIFRPKSVYSLATELDFSTSRNASLYSPSSSSSSSTSSALRRERSLPRSRYYDSSSSNGLNRSNDFYSNFNENLSYLGTSSSLYSSPNGRSSYYRPGYTSDYGSSRYKSFTKTYYAPKFRERPLLTNLNLKYGSHKKPKSSLTSTSSRHASTSSTTSSHHNSVSSTDNNTTTANSSNSSSISRPTLERNKFLIKFRENNVDVSPAKRRDSISWDIPSSFNHSRSKRPSETLSQTIEENEEVDEDFMSATEDELKCLKTIDNQHVEKDGGGEDYEDEQGKYNFVDKNNNLVRWNGTLSLNTESDDKTAEAMKPLVESIETITDCFRQADWQEELVILAKVNTAVDCKVKDTYVKVKTDKVKKKKKKPESKEDESAIDVTKSSAADKEANLEVDKASTDKEKTTEASKPVKDQQTTSEVCSVINDDKDKIIRDTNLIGDKKKKKKSPSLAKPIDDKEKSDEIIKTEDNKQKPNEVIKPIDDKNKSIEVTKPTSEKKKSPSVAKSIDDKEKSDEIIKTEGNKKKENEEIKSIEVTKPNSEKKKKPVEVTKPTLDKPKTTSPPIIETPPPVPLKPTLVKSNEGKPKKNKSVNFNLDIPDNKLSLPKSAPPSPSASVERHDTDDKTKLEPPKLAAEIKPAKKEISDNKIHHKKEIPLFHPTVVPSDVTVIKATDKTTELAKIEPKDVAQTNEKEPKLEAKKNNNNNKTELVGKKIKPTATSEIDVEVKPKVKTPSPKLKEADDKLLSSKPSKAFSATCLEINKKPAKTTTTTTTEVEHTNEPDVMTVATVVLKTKEKKKCETVVDSLPVIAKVEPTPTPPEEKVATEAAVLLLPAQGLPTGQDLKCQSSEAEDDGGKATGEMKKPKKIEATGKENEAGKVKKKKVKKALTENLSTTVCAIEAEEKKKKVILEKVEINLQPEVEEPPKPVVPIQLAPEPPKPPKEPQKIRFREYTLDDFQLLTVLGRGSFGKVLLAELRDHNVHFAIKCLKKHTVIEDDDVESIMIERKVLAMGSNNPFICKLFATFQDETTLFFAMEWCAGGDLMFHVQKDGKFSEERTRFYACEMLCALWFMHKRGIIYRDLKLDNVMIYKDGHIRLVDFGMCQGKIYREELLPSNFCGTPEYMAPEIVKGVKYNHSVDYWALGVVIYEMIVGTSPFQGTDEDELLWNVCNQEVHYPRNMSTNVKNIIILLLKKDPKERLGVTMAYGHIKDQPFFESINWSLAEQAKLRPTFVPQLTCETDVSYFDQYFTKEEPVVSLNVKPISEQDQQLFEGFNYTNPNMTE